MWFKLYFKNVRLQKGEWTDIVDVYWKFIDENREN